MAVCGMIRRLSGALVLLLALAGPAAAQDARELAAREAFAKGEYQQALDLYVKLYAETLHPTYLRNVGRCYQNLGEPDKAIASFRDYLRKVPELAPDKRAEIDRYIAEMEELKRQREKPPDAGPAVAPAPPPPAPAATIFEPVPAAPGPTPVYRRWWFWTGLAVVATGVVVGVALAAGGGGGTPHGTAGSWDMRGGK
jgi:tetratricopeptide (TPR) repeat protein